MLCGLSLLAVQVENENPSLLQARFLRSILCLKGECNLADIMQCDEPRYPVNELFFFGVDHHPLPERSPVPLL